MFLSFLQSFLLRLQRSLIVDKNLANCPDTAYLCTTQDDFWILKSYQRYDVASWKPIHLSWSEGPALVRIIDFEALIMFPNAVFITVYTWVRGPLLLALVVIFIKYFQNQY